MKLYGTFLALEQRPNISNLYKIYVTDGVLCAAKIAGKYVSEKSASSLRIVDLGKSRALYDAIESRLQVEAYYDSLPVGDTISLSADSANFSVGSALITRIRVAPLHWFSAIMTRGTQRFGNLCLDFPDSSKRHYALFGQRNIWDVGDLLKQFAPHGVA